MKKLFFLTLCLLTGAFASAQDISLPAPVKTGGLSVMEALAKRQSTNEFSEKELSNQELSNLLWAANGINRENGKKTAPSAMNAQDIAVYVALAGGLYKYDAAALKLVFVSGEDCRKLAQSPRNNTLPPCMLYLVSDLSSYPENFTREVSLSMARIDAGIVSQNISIFCAGMGIGTKPRAGMDQEKIRTALKLNDMQELILNHPVGFPQ